MIPLQHSSLKLELFVIFPSDNCFLRQVNKLLKGNHRWWARGRQSELEKLKTGKILRHFFFRPCSLSGWEKVVVLRGGSRSTGKASFSQIYFAYEAQHISIPIHIIIIPLCYVFHNTLQSEIIHSKNTYNLSTCQLIIMLSFEGDKNFRV